jgi:hypothetical protein
VRPCVSDIFKLERQLEELQKGFDSGMVVAKRQIKMLEEMLAEEKRRTEFDTTSSIPDPTLSLSQKVNEDPARAHSNPYPGAAASGPGPGMGKIHREVGPATCRPPRRRKPSISVSEGANALDDMPGILWQAIPRGVLRVGAGGTACQMLPATSSTRILNPCLFVELHRMTWRATSFRPYLEGVSAGQEFQARTPTGRTVTVTAPNGARKGTEFRVSA